MQTRKQDKERKKAKASVNVASLKTSDVTNKQIQSVLHALQTGTRQTFVVQLKDRRKNIEIRPWPNPHITSLAVKL